MPHSHPLPPFFHYGYTLLFAALPWSVGLRVGASELDFPAEPLVAVLGLGLLIHVVREPRFFTPKPSNVGVLLWLGVGWLGWMAWCAVWSSMPLVSWKYWLVEAAHWWVFAVGMAVWPKLWVLLTRVFPLSMGGVVLYTLIHHARYDFRSDQALLAPMPFFEEHTTYAAAVVFGLLGLARAGLTGRALHNVQKSILAGLLLLGLSLSNCFAAQVSAVVAALVAALVLTWQRYRVAWLLLTAALCACGLFFGGKIAGKIHDTLSRDVSALERLNRWHCAWRMAAERPLTGFGPGTFQFQYLRFQQPAQMTRISATGAVTERNPHTYGRGGGAHSEFARVLAETGWPGLLLGVAFFVAVLYGIFNRQNWLEEAGNAWGLRLSWLLVLVVFAVHGAVNDLLHGACVAVWVWGGVGQSGSRI